MIDRQIHFTKYSKFLGLSIYYSIIWPGAGKNTFTFLMPKTAGKKGPFNITI
jgi:hypothetical protein